METGNEEEEGEEETALEKAMKAATATKEDLELALEKASKTLNKNAQTSHMALSLEKLWIK